MEDWTQVLIYFAFLAIYALSKLFNRKKPVTRMPDEEVEREFDAPRQPERRPETGQRQGRSGMDEPPRRQPTTFQEILRELTGADQWEEARQQEEERTAYERQQQQARQQAKEAERRVAQKADQYSKQLGDSMRQARQAKKAGDKNLQEIDKMTAPLKKAGARRGGRSLAQSIARSLKNPDSAKRAIILSEIINRKHF